MGEADLQPLVTRCPECATQFRVSEAQLQVAKGKVRCGSCLTVFQGVDNLVWDAESEPAGSADETLDSLLDQLSSDTRTSQAELVEEESRAVTEEAQPLAEEAPAVVEELLSEEVHSAETPVEDEFELIDPTEPPDSEPKDTEPTGQAAPDSQHTPDPAAAQADGPPIPSPADDERDVLVAQLIAAAQANPNATALANEPIKVPAETDLIDLGSSYVGPEYATLARSDEERNEVQRRSRNRREALAEIRALNAEKAAEVKAQQDQANEEKAAKDKAAQDKAAQEKAAQEKAAQEKAAQAEAAERKRATEAATTKPAQNDSSTAPRAKPPAAASPPDTEPSLPKVAGERVDTADFEIDENHIADTPASTPAVTEVDLAAAAAERAVPTKKPGANAASASAPTSSSTAPYPGESELEQVWERKPPAANFDYDDAVEGEEPAKQLGWRKPAIALGSLLIVAQVLYFQFEDWSVIPAARPVYAAACSVLGCELPFRRDMALLKSRNLKVRSHPELAGKLLADALIVNEAEFDQPFPVLRLGFSDASGNPMDSQRFEPKDYLAGDMGGATMMPARTPVRISVVAQDPGPEAFGYTLNLE